MEVEFISEPVLSFCQQDINDMKNRAAKNNSGKFRYCFHKNESSHMQEMMFVQNKDVYARPHKHIEFDETQILIEGTGIVITFDETGAIHQTFQVGYKDNKFWRIQKNIYHMLIPLSEQIVIFEVREGQFSSNSNIFPSWAPKESEHEKVLSFINNIISKREEF